MRLEILGEHVSTANSFHRLGVVYCIIGELTSAIKAFQKDMRSNLLGDQPDMARSKQCVGFELETGVTRSHRANTEQLRNSRMHS